MLEQDYLVRMLLQFFEAMCRAVRHGQQEDDPQGAADMLEQAIGQATDMDGAVLLSLSPESIAQVMQVSGADPNVMQYVAHSMLLESVFLAKAGQNQLASVRSDQAAAIARAYGFELPEDPADLSAISEELEALAPGEKLADQAAVYDAFDADDPFAEFFGEDGNVGMFNQK